MNKVVSEDGQGRQFGEAQFASAAAFFRAGLEQALVPRRLELAAKAVNQAEGFGQRVLRTHLV